MDTTIKLTDVRLSFPSLFKPKAFEEGQKAKFAATFILDKVKHKALIAQINAKILEVAKEAFKGPPPKGKICLRDGSEKEHLDGYGPSVVFISAASEKRIPVVDRDVTPLTEEDSKPYAGCYVNATIRLWAQNNSYGRRVNAQLRAVQFVRDGEPFGDKPDDPTQVFDDLSGSSEEPASTDETSLL